MSSCEAPTYDTEARSPALRVVPKMEEGGRHVLWQVQAKSPGCYPKADVVRAVPSLRKGLRHPEGPDNGDLPNLYVTGRVLYHPW